jgi:hypothetical protein
METATVGASGLTPEERAWLAKARRNDINGWIHLHIEGEPLERGFQHGYLIAAEYAEALRVYRQMTYISMGMSYDFFVEKAAKYHLPIIEQVAPELLEEMRGIAAGCTRAGVPTTVEEIVGWNAYEEMSGYHASLEFNPFSDPRDNALGHAKNRTQTLVTIARAAEWRQTIRQNRSNYEVTKGLIHRAALHYHGPSRDRI